MIGTSRIEVFDVDAEWEEVVPHLDEEGVVHALDCGMRRGACSRTSHYGIHPWGPISSASAAIGPDLH